MNLSHQEDLSHWIIHPIKNKGDIILYQSIVPHNRAQNVDFLIEEQIIHQ